MKIESNGYHKVKGHGKGQSVVLVSGNTGGATIVLGYVDDYDSFIPLIDGALALDSQYKVNNGVETPIYLKVTGATGTTAVSLFINGLI